MYNHPVDEKKIHRLQLRTIKESLSIQGKTSAYLLNMRRVKIKAALLFLSLLGFSIIPEGTIRSCPSGEKQSRLKKDLSVSSWKRRTTLPCRSELSGTGNWALLTRLTNFLLLTLYTRHILQIIIKFSTWFLVS